MKKEVLLLTFFLLFTIPLVFAADNVTDSQKINNAYTCLNDKITEKGCADLSTEEKIFSVLAVGKCKSELEDDSSNMECWPENNCDIKTTAQAILALKNADDAEDWLIGKNISTSGMNWYLEIDSSGLTTCTITYEGSPHSISIGEDKKISADAGGCLSLSQGDYWLRVSESCYGDIFEIECTQGFLSTFLFQKEDSDTIHVLKETKTASAGGTVNMQIKSSCFSTGSTCDYEGTLWATMALDYIGEDISAYTPYLLTLSEDNQEFLPESFIYYLTDYSDAKTELISKQKTSGYWDESGDKFYDTAVALYPFQSESFDGKTTAKNWLFDQQDSEGCWQGNIRNTAFILHSVFPKIVPGIGSTEDCEDEGYDCMSSISCTGEILDNYECGGLLKCCSVPQEVKTCTELIGEICNSNQDCSGLTEDASNLESGEVCCVTGSCQDSSMDSEPTCETNGGRCDTFNCESNEDEVSYTCEDLGDICCLEKNSSSGSSLWIWILIILILLVIIGFFFKDKLGMFWMQISSKFGKGKPSSGGDSPRSPPVFPSTRMPSPMNRQQRRILPPRQDLRPQMRRPVEKKPSEMDEVLRKLKEMSK